MTNSVLNILTREVLFLILFHLNPRIIPDRYECFTPLYYPQNRNYLLFFTITLNLPFDFRLVLYLQLFPVLEFSSHLKSGHFFIFTIIFKLNPSFFLDCFFHIKCYISGNFNNFFFFPVKPIFFIPHVVPL